MKIDLSKVKETAKEVLNKVTERFQTFVTWLRAFTADTRKRCSALAEKTGPLPARLSQIVASIRLPAEKKRPMFFAIGGAAVLFLVLLITIAALGSRRPGGGASMNMRNAHLIPPEELFIPDEPDFLPDFLLEREPRHFWSIDDIRPYWRSPGNPEFWHNVIRSAVDELMENVP